MKHVICFIWMLLFGIYMHAVDLYKIHYATLHDLQDILSLDATISDEYFIPLLLLYPEYENNQQRAKDFLDAELEKDKVWLAECIAMKDEQRLFIVRENNACVGFVACHKQDNTIVMIDLLFIDACYRNKGIGKALIERCIQEFPEAGSCMLVVIDKNESARKAYEKIGFVLVADRPSFVEDKYPKPYYLCYRKPL